MLHVLVTLASAILVVAIALAITLLHGHLHFDVDNISIDTSASVALVALALFFVTLYAVLRALSALLNLPRGWRAWRRRRHRAQGDEAVTRALVALAAGDGRAARWAAALARRLLGDTAQTLLLAVEAARLSKREPEAEAALHMLTLRKDTAFLGLRGLFRLAMARQDFSAAAKLAGEAEAAHPDGSWLRGERTRLAVRIGDWSGALALADARASKAALATAAADASTDSRTAMKLARLAWKADPGLAPAALTYATRLRAAGKERRALAVIRQSWARAPHPGLAAFVLTQAGGQLEQYQAAQRIAEANPDHVESRSLLARAALAAGLTGEARRQAEGARAAGLEQRRLWSLVAEIEGDGEGARHALQHALAAQPDPTWRCRSCHSTQAAWQPVCPTCGAVGEIR